MDKVNTVKKGDEFEELCYDLIKASLESGQLGLMSAFCKVFKKKGYYSHARRSEIFFDIAIEMWLPGAEHYTLLYLIECKNYKGKVPVDDVEEFYTKATQIIGLNGKGVFITNKAFQSGGYRFARSMGMMLLTVNNDITLNIVLYKADRYRQMQIEKDTVNITPEDYQDPFLKEIIHQRWKRKIDQLLIASFLYQDILPLTDSEDSDKNIPVLSKADIEEVVTLLLNSYDSSILQQAKSLDWPEFITFLLDAFELKIVSVMSLGLDRESRRILGTCDFSNKIIQIDSTLYDLDRFSFILAHEVGHFLLHNKTVISQSAYENFKDSEYSFLYDRHRITNDRNWLEWQANQFASNLIMPTASIIYRFGLEMEKIGLRAHKPLFVDNQPCNQDSFHRVTRNLAGFFKTPKTTIIYRLDELNLLNFGPQRGSLPRTSGQIIREIYPNIF